MKKHIYHRYIFETFSCAEYTVLKCLNITDENISDVE